MNPIYKFEFDPDPTREQMNREWSTKHVMHLDLEKIVAIHAPTFVNRMGSGGHFVAFEIDVQLRDKSIYREYHVAHGETWEQTLEKLRVVVHQLTEAWIRFRSMS